MFLFLFKPFLFFIHKVLSNKSIFIVTKMEWMKNGQGRVSESRLKKRNTSFYRNIRYSNNPLKTKKHFKIEFHIKSLYNVCITIV